MFPDNMPWYKSRIVIGAVISVLMKLLVLTGILDTAFNEEAVTDAVLLVIGGIADLWIMKERFTQKAAPTLTT